MRLGQRRSKKNLFYVALAAVVSLTAACSVEKLKSSGTKPVYLPSGLKRNPVVAQNSTQKKPEVPATQNPSSDDALGEKAEPLVMNLTTNYAEGRQRKNLVQLKDAILNCVGKPEDDSIVDITADMLLVDTQLAENKDKVVVLGEGRQRFLMPNLYGTQVGQSILDAEKSYLQVDATRTGLTADSLEDEIYLKSLVTVASVAAFNCDVQNVNSNCYCADQKSAERMLARCLPQFSPNTAEFKAAVEGLYSPENCGASIDTQEGFKKRRRAIAALLSSYAFATAK